MADVCTSPLVDEELFLRIEALVLLGQFRSNIKYIFENSLKDSNPSIPFSFNSKLDNVVENSCFYLITNIDKKHSLSSLSRAVGTNRNALTIAFQDRFGMSVFAWLRQERMKKAKDLLLETDLTISSISLLVGYENFTSFSTCFRRYYESSPSAYRKKMTRSKV